MADEYLPRPSSVDTADESGFSAVVAHSMLGTLAAIRGAIDTAMQHESFGSGRDAVLMIAVRRLEFLTQQLRDIAAGVPGSAVVLDLRTYLENDSGESSP